MMNMCAWLSKHSSRTGRPEFLTKEQGLYERAVQMIVSVNGSSAVTLQHVFGRVQLGVNDSEVPRIVCAGWVTDFWLLSWRIWRVLIDAVTEFKNVTGCAANDFEGDGDPICAKVSLWMLFGIVDATGVMCTQAIKYVLTDAIQWTSSLNMSCYTAERMVTQWRCSRLLLLMVWRYPMVPSMDFSPRIVLQQFRNMDGTLRAWFNVPGNVSGFALGRKTQNGMPFWHIMILVCHN